MNEKKLRIIMLSLITIGLLLVAIGISFIIFTDIVTENGTNGILLIAGLIAGGLFLSVPAKIYLTLQMMKYNDEKLILKNQQRTSPDEN